MNRAFQAASDVVSGLFCGVSPGLACLVLCLASGAVSPSTARAAPFIWDQDTDGIDDRMESVHLFGYTYSFENSDTLAHQRVEVVRLPSGLFYGAYVVYDHVPTGADLAALALLGMPVLHRYENVTAIRTLATFTQIQLAAALAGVERIEAVQVLYPQVHDGVASLGVRDPSEQCFPTWAGTGGGDGSGVVIAFLDTGVNDTADGTYPGHEALLGRCLGGASYVQQDSLLNTPPDGSENPVDRGGALTQSHGTHVAAIALGNGGASGYSLGVAPGARFVDVKVLTDAGSGVSIGEGLDWCIHNRARNWGVAGYNGIHIVNLSLSSTDLTDGNDVVSRLANRAVELGMVVVASIGNGGHASFVPSPAGASRVLAVGAIDGQRTPQPEDDVWAAFNNYGPRANNGGANAQDEQKPDLMAPGVSVLAADGSLASDGAQYHRLSGTSMAAAFVSGVVAAIRSSYPTMTPVEIAELLRSTARRDLGGAPPNSGGADPRWRSTFGFGIVDLYAARLEKEQPSSSQVVQLELGSTATTITATWRTQRELGAAAFVIERAPDVGGSPGAFAPYDSAAATGSSSLAGFTNRHGYTRTWAVPTDERGIPFWYRAAYTENGIRRSGPARLYTSPTGPSIATVRFTIVHDAYDHDLTGRIAATGPGATFSVPLPGTAAAVSSDWVTGESMTGTVAWSYRIEVPEGTATAPGTSQPWWIRADEAGYLNRSGRITQFQVVWHGPSGDVTYDGGPAPVPTVEGQSVYSSAPQTSLAVGDDPTASPKLRFGPNPVVVGARVSFALAATRNRSLEILDITGRRVARAAFRPTGGGDVATWETRDASGRPVPPGIYLARIDSRAAVRIVVVRP